MKSTSSKNLLQKRKIPNEISGSSEDLQPKPTEANLDQHLVISEGKMYYLHTQNSQSNNKECKRRKGSLTEARVKAAAANDANLKHRKKPSNFDVNVFQIDNMNHESLDQQFYYQIPTHQLNSNQSSEPLLTNKISA